MDPYQLRFRQWNTPKGVSASVLLNGPSPPGVYILGFADGAEYVGKTVNFPTRFSAHRRRWPDITTVRFAAVLAEDLDDAERSLVQQRVDAGFALRNKTLLSQPTGSSPLDLVVDQEVQAAWLSTDEDADDIHMGDQRLQLARRRLASRERLEALKSHPLFDAVRTSIAAYIEQVIPWPEQTEGRQWTLTALPSTARRRDNRRLATLSIQNVEMLYLGEARDRNDRWASYTCLNTAPLSRTPRLLWGRSQVHGSYRSAGRVQSFDLTGCHVLPNLLADYPEVRHAARRLALGQLRKGQAMFSRLHNDAFADEVFAEIADRSAALSSQ